VPHADASYRDPGPTCQVLALMRQTLISVDPHNPLIFLSNKERSKRSNYEATSTYFVQI
jgi:hypothetical protein